MWTANIPRFTRAAFSLAAFSLYCINKQALAQYIVRQFHAVEALWKALLHPLRSSGRLNSSMGGVRGGCGGLAGGGVEGAHAGGHGPAGPGG